MICPTQVRDATNSEPYVAASEVAFFLENQSIGVLLRKCNTPVTDLSVSISC